MATKQMKVIKKATNEIQLQGYGVDALGNSFSDYALSIYLSDNKTIEYIKLHMLDRGVEIEYLQ